MIERIHWLSVVEDILNSSTSNLRRLAEIAGCDPVTFYIGTKLNGADVRGQDLRGMILPQLNKNAVQWDAGTIFGDSSGDKSSNELSIKSEEFKRHSCLILVKAPRSHAEIQTLSRRFPTAAIYDFNDQEKFEHACSIFDGPKFFVSDISRKTQDRLSILLDVECITILVRRSNRAFNVSDLDFISTQRNPVLLVTIPNQVYPGAPQLLPGAPIDALRIALDNWSELLPIIRENTPAVFIRARASGTTTDDEAWTRVLSEMRRIDVENCQGYRFSLDYNQLRNSGIDIDNIILPQLKELTLPLNGDSKMSSQVAVILNLNSTLSGERSFFRTTIIRMFEAYGWHISHIREERFTVKGETAKYVLRLYEEKRNLRRNAQRSFEFPIRNYFANVQTLLIGETLLESDVVNYLQQEQILCVSVRDVFGFEAHRSSIWSLLSRQIKRVGRSPDVLSRTRYLWMIIRSAIDNVPIDKTSQQDGLEIFDDNDFSSNYILKCRKLSVYTDETTCRIDVIKKVQAEVESREIIYWVDLRLDEDGIWILRARDLRLEPV